MLPKIKFLIRGILGFFENLERIPNIEIESEVLTKSAGGKEIKKYILGNGNKKILVLGCVHGNEIGTSKLISLLINYLKYNDGAQNGKTIFFIPTLNADGFSKAQKNPDYLNGGSLGRTNGNNVDLNRNFDTKDWVKEGIWEFGNKKVKVLGGAKPFSEPETKTLVDFIQKNKIEIIFDYHNRAGTVLATDNEVGKKIATIYTKYSGYKNITGSVWQNTGWSKDYFESKGVTYIEIETTKRWGSDFTRNKEAFLESLKAI